MTDWPGFLPRMSAKRFRWIFPYSKQSGKTARAAKRGRQKEKGRRYLLSAGIFLFLPDVSGQCRALLLKNESRRQPETVWGNHLPGNLLEGIGSVRGIDRASFEIPQLLGGACIVNQVIGMMCTAAGPANQKHRSGRDGIHVFGK